MKDLPYTHLNYMTTLTTFSWFSPYLGGKRRKSETSSASPPSIDMGWSWECGWLGPPLFSVLANEGAGGRGLLLHMTIYTYLTSYAQRPQEFSSLTLVLIHTYSQIIGSCAGSSGPVHNVVQIDVYLDLETPGGWDFG
jgi:hypothetical protein